MLEYKILKLADPSRPWIFNEFTDRLKSMRKEVEDHVFANYSWNHMADAALGQIYDPRMSMCNLWEMKEIRSCKFSGEL